MQLDSKALGDKMTRLREELQRCETLFVSTLVQEKTKVVTAELVVWDHVLHAAAESCCPGGKGAGGVQGRPLLLC